MGLFKSKEDKVLGHFKSTYRENMADLNQARINNDGGDFAFLQAHHQSMRWATKSTQDRFRIRIGTDSFDRALLEMSCAEFGFNVNNVLNAQNPYTPTSQDRFMNDLLGISWREH